MLFAQFRMLPDTASTVAEEVDGLFLYILAWVIFFTLAIAITVIVFITRYRRRPNTGVPPQVHGGLRLEVVWTVIPTLIALTMFWWGAKVYFDWAEPPPDALPVYVVGRQWMWHLQHAGGQREINQLHVPVGRPVKLTITSQDVVHNFFVPAFRLHHDAIPGRYATVWFEATRTGEFDLFCSEYCGTNHSAMIGKIVVQDRDEHARWLTERADTSLATEGRKLFQKLQCVTCHSANARARAPVLENIHLRRVPLHDGKVVVADDDYLRESIRNPNAKIVAGFQRPSIMPPFGPDVVDETDMIRLLAFLRALGPGQTPPRVEEAEPPTARPETAPAMEKQGKDDKQ
jgi:cytochrome c oxidase subunit 2